jgi:predicted RNA binding protein YcfA (HicA-like mRNA interferase family)
MSQWGSVKARHLLRALLAIGWRIKREGGGSHKILSRVAGLIMSLHFTMASRSARKCFLELPNTQGCNPAISDSIPTP